MKMSGSGLNEKQQNSVEYARGPAVILAGAGSGKTRVLIHKVLYFIEQQKVDPSQIVMITFTNKAAGEMKERIFHATATTSGSKLGFVGTFHSLCCQILRRDGVHIGLDHNFSIYDDDDQAALIKKILNNTEGRKLTPSYVQYRISAAKNHLITPSEYLLTFSDYNASYVAKIYNEYQKELLKNQAVDFDDLIGQVVKLFTRFPDVLKKYQRRFTHFLVDEFQDTNVSQYTLVKLLASGSQNITVVGDFSQSIYSWRGADIRNLQKFQEDFPNAKTFELDQNYRSTQTILNFAFDVISKNQTHPVLQLFTANTQGEQIEYEESENEQDEAIFVAREIERLKKSREYHDFAVLYRTNAQSRVIEEAFLHYGIPYVLIGGVRFYERKEIKDVLSYLRLFVNKKDTVARERLEKIGKRRYDKYLQFIEKNDQAESQFSTIDLMNKIFQVTGYLDLYNKDDPEEYAKLENIKELKSVANIFPKVEEFLEQVALVESEYFEKEKKGGNKDGVRLMTMHQAKGLEFPYVFIVGVEEGILPHVRSMQDLYQLEEERRLFYVGITRAKEKLYITYTRRRFIFGRRNETTKSRFLGSDENSSYNY